MRNPFIRTLTVTPVLEAQADFVHRSRGGSAFLAAGTVFWSAATLVAVFASPNTASLFYIWGGFIVPFVGFAIGRRQGAELTQHSTFTIAVAIASAITPFCIPVLIVLQQHDPRLVAPALTIIDGAHVLFLMWVHLDYTYFLLSMSKLVIGSVFLLGLPQYALVGAGALSAIADLAAFILVLRDPHDPLQTYSRFLLYPSSDDGASSSTPSR